MFDDFTFARLAFVIVHLGILFKLIIFSSSAFSLLLTHVQCDTCILLFTAVDWTIRQFDPQGMHPVEQLKERTGLERFYCFLLLGGRQGFCGI